METTFEEKIHAIFGTSDLRELQKMANEAAQYRKQIQKEETHRKAGRHSDFSMPQVARMLAMKQDGKSITAIADFYHVSRQTIYNQINQAQHFSRDPDQTLRMCYMYRDHLCTTIDVDFRHERIAIQNYTDQIPLRAFGIVTQPSWKDFEWFLEDRCFPSTRDHAKDILKELDVPFYDPLLIIEKTRGIMAEDQNWILLIKKRDGRK